MGRRASRQVKEQMQDSQSRHVTILMRVLPSSGIGRASRTMAHGHDALSVFREHASPQAYVAPNQYCRSARRLHDARPRALDRIEASVDERVSPIIVGSDDNVDVANRRYVAHAIEHWVETAVERTLLAA